MMAVRTALLMPILMMGSVAAAEICPKLEYPEMDAMPADELMSIRCQYRDSMGELTGPKLNQGTLAEGHLMLSWARQCGQQMDRMDRILGRKYAISGSPDNVSRELARRCRK